MKHLKMLNDRDIKLIALDLDGTLTGSDKLISKRNYQSLMYAQRQGIKLVLATGRSVHGTQKIAERLDLEQYGGYMICYNGALVWDCQNQYAVYEDFISTALLKELYDASKAFNVTIQTYIGDKLYTEDIHNPYVKKAAKINGLSITRTQCFVDEISQPVPKCLIPGDPAILKEILVSMQQNFKGKANIFLSEPCFIEIVPWGTDKGRALQTLSRTVKIQLEEMIAFGDGYNDISMIRAVGYGVAMANAVEEVKAAAQTVTDTNDQDGVALIVEQLFRQN